MGDAWQPRRAYGCWQRVTMDFEREEAVDIVHQRTLSEPGSEIVTQEMGRRPFP
jgi:hypothetical protein